MRSLSWQDRAACAGQPSEVFFPQSGNSAGDHVAEAKAICATCPVRAACLDYALALEATTGTTWTGRYGVWGGLTAQERRDLVSGGRARACVDCAAPFEQGRRGAPRQRCPDCAAAHRRAYLAAWRRRRGGAA